jgi:ubiquinone/menaquinone biosynthesis C-methylase UbiE
MDESERIRRVYAQRVKDGSEAKYSLFNDASLYSVQRREREILKTLESEGFISLSDKRILDVGCGDGGGLRRLLAYGASPRNLWGIDLLGERILVAKDTHPLMCVFLGNAETLPFATQSFDLVMQFTVFSSILDQQVRRQVA